MIRLLKPGQAIFFLLLIFLLPLNAASLGSQSKYKEGQVWSYKTRPHEKESELIIVRIETAPSVGRIIHISLNGLKVKNPDPAINFNDAVAFMPFAEKAIDKSVVKLLRENAQIPDFSEGYNEWRLAFDDGRATVYKVSVADAVGKLEKKLNKSERF